MEFIYFILIILFVLSAIILYLIAPGRSTSLLRAPFKNRNIAHRGLHTQNKLIPENSMTAFKEAIKYGYGIELDVQFSKDEQLVVFHDNTLNRVCGIIGRVDDFTYNELETFTICNTNERIPLLSDVLKTVAGRVPLVVELKNGPKNKNLCERTYQLLNAYSGPFCVESFQPLIVGWFKNHAPEILRGQLSAPATEFNKEIKRYQAFALSHLLTNAISRPHFIAYEKNKGSFLVSLVDIMGAMRVVWTVRDSDNYKEIEGRNDLVIFEFYRPDPFY